MKIISDDGTSRQRCRSCNVLLEVVSDDVLIESGWFHYRCMNCQRLNEMTNVPDSFYPLLHATME